ncbi:hypothetical protein CO015_03120 [candidate division WWE3 bacterium CG_4_8_14_3_um_filter_42_11]|uniref:Glycosyltransferase family 1 protein n=2 Tax=Katanobacteria TaxID=422282 RepID=A0A2M7TAV3_UNCKA|nr:MAG: hypothetical protein COY34_03490 [candidate division WWE3 bacterium CG_4_10_14_0_2_um_filter_42_8]PJC68688.1 MAG: hypothetical protein CO015_03120 [candidate division WWE3 bacterium CG_4_8_14_3_um_filter_42_11]
MKIGIEARFYGLQYAGLGRYVKNLIAELEQVDFENTYFILLGQENFEAYNPVNPNFKKVKLAGHPYSLASQLFDWTKIRSLNLDLVHFTHFSFPTFYRGKFVVTIHDLIKSEYYTSQASSRSFWMQKLKTWGYQYVLKKAIGRAERIVTPSNFVKQEILKNYQVDQNKIIPIYEGAEDKFKNLKVSPQKCQKILGSMHITKPFLLYVGSLYPYKNVEVLIRAVKEINIARVKPADQDLTLVIVCPPSFFVERFEQTIQAEEAGRFVKMAGFVKDESLAVLYSQALAYITASLSEGFGITGLEAMAAGCPVLSSNSSCLSEVYGEAAFYFNPQKTAEIIQAVEKVKTDPQLRRTLIEKGKKQVQQYSWRKMAQEILTLYREVLTT